MIKNTKENVLELLKYKSKMYYGDFREKGDIIDLVKTEMIDFCVDVMTNKEIFNKEYQKMKEQK